MTLLYFSILHVTSHPTININMLHSKSKTDNEHWALGESLCKCELKLLDRSWYFIFYLLLLAKSYMDLSLINIQWASEDWHWQPSMINSIPNMNLIWTKYEPNMVSQEYFFLKFWMWRPTQPLMNIFHFKNKSGTDHSALGYHCVKHLLEPANHSRYFMYTSYFKPILI